MKKVGDDEYVIHLSGLKNGTQVFSFYVDKNFFEYFENQDVIDADVEVSVAVEKTGSCILLACKSTGTLTVPCDRCLKDLALPVDFEYNVTVRFVKDSEEDVDSEDSLVLEAGQADLDMRQIIYDYIMINLPLQRFHDIKDCDPAVISKMNFVAGRDAELNAVSPFAGLKDIINEK